MVMTNELKINEIFKRSPDLLRMTVAVKDMDAKYDLNSLALQYATVGASAAMLGSDVLIPGINLDKLLICALLGLEFASGVVLKEKT